MTRYIEARTRESRMHQVWIGLNSAKALCVHGSRQELSKIGWTDARTLSFNPETE